MTEFLSTLGNFHFARLFSKPGWRLFGVLALAIAGVIAGLAGVGNATAAGDSIGVPGLEKFMVQVQHRATMFLLLTLELLAACSWHLFFRRTMLNPASFVSYSEVLWVPS